MTKNSHSSPKGHRRVPRQRDHHRRRKRRRRDHRCAPHRVCAALKPRSHGDRHGTEESACQEAESDRVHARGARRSSRLRRCWCRSWPRGTSSPTLPRRERASRRGRQRGRVRGGLEHHGHGGGRRGAGGGVLARLTTLGLFTTVLFVTHLLMQVPAGRLSDRFGPGRVCAAGLVVLAACNAVALVSPEPWLVLVARGAMGVGTAFAFIGGSDYVRATGGSPFSQGLYGGFATAGAGVALAVVPALVGPLGWRAPFASAVVVAACSALVLAASGRARDATGHGCRHAGPAAPARRAPRPGRGTFAASFGLSVVIGDWVVTLLEDRRRRPRRRPEPSALPVGSRGRLAPARRLDSACVSEAGGQAITAGALVGAAGITALVSARCRWRWRVPASSGCGRIPFAASSPERPCFMPEPGRGSGLRHAAARAPFS